MWDDEIAGRLAKQFIEDDLALSIGGDASGSPPAEEGARALWMMAVNVCPADFPDGEIENGLR